MKELLIGILGDRLSIFQLTLLRFSSKILNNTKIIKQYAFADRWGQHVASCEIIKYPKHLYIIGGIIFVHHLSKIIEKNIGKQLNAIIDSSV